MEKEQATPVLYGGGGERGTGGKFRKLPARKPPSTPYDRPTAIHSAQRSNGGWLSKIVDPACRLIAGGATKILPSFFSKSPYTAALLPSNTDDDGTDKWGSEVTPNANDDDKYTANFGMTRSTEGAGPSKVAERLKRNSERDELARDKINDLSDDSEFSKIEQLMKGKFFSRDEINRLTDILNSRVDLSNVECEENKPSMAATGNSEGALLAHENPRTSIEEKQEEMNRATLRTSMPLLQSNMQDEVSASPIDIAKAYMGSRTSEIGLDSSSMIKNERAVQPSDGFTSNQFIPSPSPMSSTCWPGAMVQDHRGYITPRSQRGMYGLHKVPQTPYSGTIHSKCMSKLTQLQADSRCLNISSTTFSQQSQTPMYGQVKSRSHLLDGGYGSVGPIRRIRHKSGSEAQPRGSISPYSSQIAPSPVEKSNVSKGFLPAIEKSLEPGGTSGTSSYQSVDHMVLSSKVGVPVLNPSSSQAARKILEHLDRTTPTPKEKAAELKLATAWRKPPPSEVTDVMPRENSSFPHLGGFNLHKNTYLIDQNFSAEGHDDSGHSNNKVKPHERSNSEATVAVNASTYASSSVIGDTGMIRDANAGPSLVLNNTCEAQIKSKHEISFVGTDGRQKETSQLWPFVNQANGPDVMKMVPNAAGSELLKKPPSHFSGTKPMLASISINKPYPIRTVSSDNGVGFTFPVSASSGVLSEPPTPSIMPSFSASGLPQPKEGPAVPSYSFGTKKSTPRLVFSFPSTSSASTYADGSDLKFDFGSNKKTRVSFSSVGKDAICY